jgi:hypothetical protein
MATTFKIDSWNVGAIKAAVDVAFNDTAEVVDRQLSLAIISETWTWPRHTWRKNGEYARSPRNIIDSADLLNSQKMKKMGRRSVMYSWNTSYALLVHFGYRRKGTTVPGRPWTKLGLQKSNAEGVFVQSFTRSYR